MTQDFIIGREGNAPFPIPASASAVSRQHARITIDGDRWTLEDLASGNGTFIRDNQGNMVRVSKVSITPDTFIILGSDNVKGCSFYARHVLSPNSYADEFYYIKDKKQEFAQRLDRAERKARYIKWGTTGISALALLFSLFLTDPKGTIMFLRLSSMVTVISGLTYDPLSARKRIKAQEQQFMQCPNPDCHNTLTDNDVKNMHCPRCRAQ
ncbi:MAG: FHA domain-containing protein [Muribaculaceae bacterium]|nr:FHA domain-containing protein [Muribaculaceae bacterium]